jgi:hypothetical protein
MSAAGLAERIRESFAQGSDVVRTQAGQHVHCRATDTQGLVRIAGQSYISRHKKTLVAKSIGELIPFWN